MPIDISIFISTVALVISGLALWLSHLSPFSPELMNGPPRLRVYTITPDISGNEEGDVWWIPSFDVEVTVYNTGQRPGKLEDFRISGEMSGEEFEFKPKFVVDSDTFKNHNERFEWLPKAVTREWYPTIVAGNEEKRLHVILEPLGGRWDEIKSGLMEITFDVKYEGDQWDTQNRYGLYVHQDMFEDKSGVIATKIENWAIDFDSNEDQ